MGASSKPTESESSCVSSLVLFMQQSLLLASSRNGSDPLLLEEVGCLDAATGNDRVLVRKFTTSRSIKRSFTPG